VARHVRSLRSRSRGVAFACVRSRCVRVVVGFPFLGSSYLDACANSRHARAVTCALWATPTSAVKRLPPTCQALGCASSSAPFTHHAHQCAPGARDLRYSCALRFPGHFRQDPACAKARRPFFGSGGGAVPESVIEGTARGLLFRRQRLSLGAAALWREGFPAEAPPGRRAQKRCHGRCLPPSPGRVVSFEWLSPPPPTASLLPTRCLHMMASRSVRRWSRPFRQL
jgi:hypothetical protein